MYLYLQTLCFWVGFIIQFSFIFLTKSLFRNLICNDVSMMPLKHNWNISVKVFRKSWVYISQKMFLKKSIIYSTLNVRILDQGKHKLSFYFQSSLQCLKKFLGLHAVYKKLWGNTKKYGECSNYLRHIAIEKDILSEFNRCIFQISLKHIKFILVLCSFNFYFKIKL